MTQDNKRGPGGVVAQVSRKALKGEAIAMKIANIGALGIKACAEEQNVYLAQNDRTMTTKTQGLSLLHDCVPLASGCCGFCSPLLQSLKQASALGGMEWAARAETNLPRQGP